MSSPAKLPTCSEDTITRADILYRNGFGIQGPDRNNIGDKYVICFCSEPSEKGMDLFRRESGSTTLAYDDCFGTGYIKVHWTEYNKIEAILSSLLLHGTAFNLHIKCKVPYSPEQHKAFKWSELEANIVTTYSNIVKESWFKFEFLREESLFPSSLFDIWNWKTVEGRAFCSTLRQCAKVPVQDEKTDKCNYWNWPIFKPQPASGFTEEELAKAVPPKSCGVPSGLAMEDVPIPVVEEVQTCMICLDKPADTFILPCQHQVVCKGCSAQLVATPDKNKCIRCRRPISEIFSE
jgi:hypothetical protein